MTPHAPIEAVLSTADVHLLLYAGMAVFALVAVASLAVPVLDAVRRWLR